LSRWCVPDYPVGLAAVVRQGWVLAECVHTTVSDAVPP